MIQSFLEHIIVCFSLCTQNFNTFQVDPDSDSIKLIELFRLSLLEYTSIKNGIFFLSTATKSIYTFYCSVLKKIGGGTARCHCFKASTITITVKVTQQQQLLLKDRGFVFRTK